MIWDSSSHRDCKFVYWIGLIVVQNESMRRGSIGVYIDIRDTSNTRYCTGHIFGQTKTAGWILQFSYSD